MISRPAWALSAQPLRWSCKINARPRLLPPPNRTYARFSSSSSASTSARSSATPMPPPKPRQGGFYIPLSLLVIIPTVYYFWPSTTPSLSPQAYSDHPISSSTTLTPSHKLITVPLSPASLASFRPLSTSAGDNIPAGNGSGGEEIAVQHIMIKSPDLQIERPYTPLNDPLADGELQLVIKRVKGGEVGRHVHSIPPGGDIGLRGPLETLRISPGEYDRVMMISSGTGIAPFLQLLSKVPQSGAGGGEKATRYHLIHAISKTGAPDWTAASTFPVIEQLQAKHGEALRIDRISLDPLDQSALSSLLQRRKNERVMVLVCLPPHLMRPICGPLTITLGQGELTGALKELGLRSEEVWKLE